MFQESDEESSSRELSSDDEKNEEKRGTRQKSLEKERHGASTEAKAVKKNEPEPMEEDKQDAGNTAEPEDLNSSVDVKVDDDEGNIDVDDADDADDADEQSSSGKGESDSDYEGGEKNNGSEDDDVDNHSDSQSKSQSASEDESSSDEYSKKKKKTQTRRPSNKIDEKTIRLLEDENYLRRSSRAKNRKDSSEEPSEQAPSSSEYSEDERPKRRSTTNRGKTNKRQQERPVKSTRGAAKKGQYKEESSDEDEVNESDVLEWEEEKPAAEANGVINETIEKVIKSRLGVPGAAGSATTCYNVAERGDPNEVEGAEKTERQYLIKWVGWSHMHNTWESQATLLASNVNGMKKVQNFDKKAQELADLRSTMDKEYIEFFECEQMMNDDLVDEYKKVERIVVHQVSRDRAPDGTQANEFFVKWSGLPYSECTWEEHRLLPQKRIDEYFERIDKPKCPHKSEVMKRRPKFVKLEEMPEYLSSPYNDSTLRDYQLMGLNWMLHAWCKGNSCILADEMGLGKTIQSISFLSSLFHRYKIYGPFLVVVPLSTMSAWQKEFQQWAPNLNLVTYMGDVSSRDMIRQYEWNIAGTKKLKLNACLTTFEILLKDKSFLGSCQWAALLVDEAHRLKNDESLLYKCLSQFHVDHRLLITGTPLQNSLKELWALLHFIMPEEFASWDEFEEAYKDQEKKGFSSLHKKLEPYLLRRVKKDVEKSLPAKVEKILRVDMTAQQKQYYKWILTKNYRELSKGVKGSINGFVNLVMELKKCCNHTSLVRAYDEYETNAQARLQQLLKSSGKLILLDKLLVRMKEAGHRVLIFSQMVMMLDVIQEYLQLRRFNSQRLDGSMRADLRKAALDHFNAEGSNDFCFLLSTRAGGLGINLATADTVIIFDSDWNPQNDLQAMSRAHRIGQTKKVNIYRLVTRASVEEQIVERAKQKLVLDHLVIQRMDTTGRTVLSKSSATGSVPFDKSELNDILKFGAVELFKEKEGDEQEPEVDIDQILMGAETRECEDSAAQDNELLSAFKYANFVIDEEKDLAMAAKKEEQGQTWDDIIPEEERKKVVEEERQKEMAELNLGPRVRTKVNEDADAEDDAGGSESDASGGSQNQGGRKRRRKAFGDFSAKEIKQFLRAFKKFAHPLERLEAIAQDAELEEHSTEELRKLGEALLEGCKTAQEGADKVEADKADKKEDDKDSGEKDDENGGKTRNRGPQFKFADVVEVFVRPLMKGHADLEPLHLAVEAVGSESKLRVPPNARSQKGWDVPWQMVDDTALLRGIYKYGYGSWEAIKMDPDLGLAEKVFLKDKVKKPQPKHLQQRVDYLMKLLKTGKDKKRQKNREVKEPKSDPIVKEVKEKKERKRKAEENTKPEKKKTREEKPDGKPVKDKEKKVKKEENGEKEKKKPNAIRIEIEGILGRMYIKKEIYGRNLEETSDKTFRDCVKEMTPVQKYIKKLSAEHSEKDEAKYLHRIGDAIVDAVLEKATKVKSTKYVERHLNHLWIFLSKFIPQEPGELLEKYRRHLAGKHKHKHHSTVSSPTPKDKEKEKEKHEGHRRDDKDKEKSHHRHHQKPNEQHEQRAEHQQHQDSKERIAPHTHRDQHDMQASHSQYAVATASSVDEPPRQERWERERGATDRSREFRSSTDADEHSRDREYGTPLRDGSREHSRDGYGGSSSSRDRGERTDFQRSPYKQGGSQRWNGPHGGGRAPGFSGSGNYNGNSHHGQTDRSYNAGGSSQRYGQGSRGPHTSFSGPLRGHPPPFVSTPHGSAFGCYGPSPEPKAVYSGTSPGPECYPPPVPPSGLFSRPPPLFASRGDNSSAPSYRSPTKFPQDPRRNGPPPTTFPPSFRPPAPSAS